MRSKPLMVLIGLVVAATLLFSGSGMAVAQDNGGQVGAQACVAPCLYDQLTLGQTNGWVSQNFESLDSLCASVGKLPQCMDNQAADDFTIPPGSFFWLVNKVEVDGFYQQPPSGYAAASANVFFYNNSGSGSLPGTSSYQGSFVPGNLANGDFVIDLNPPAGLLAGRTYWVSVQANLDLGSDGRVWFWGLRGPPQDPLTGNLAAWINQGGGFTVGPCTTWGPLASCGGSDPGDTTDLQFRLSGSQINIAARVYLPLISR